MTKSSGAILLRASMRFGPAGPPCRAFKIAPGNFVDDAKHRPAGLGSGTGPSTSCKYLAPLLLVSVLAGCSSLLHSDAPPVQVYTLRAASESPRGGADPAAPVDASLRVAHPIAAPGLGTSQIVLLQPDHRLNVYAASAWAADAPALIESLAAETLRGSGHWRSVEDAESPFPSDYLLQITIRRFDAD